MPNWQFISQSPPPQTTRPGPVCAVSLELVPGPKNRNLWSWFSCLISEPVLRLPLSTHLESMRKPPQDHLRKISAHPSQVTPSHCTGERESYRHMPISNSISQEPALPAKSWHSSLPWIPLEYHAVPIPAHRVVGRDRVMSALLQRIKDFEGPRDGRVRAVPIHGYPSTPVGMAISRRRSATDLRHGSQIASTSLPARNDALL